jgi:hypothetical protein
MSLRSHADPKDAPVDDGGGGGAVTNWTALDYVFPSGMKAAQDVLKLPMVMHNRQWSAVSDYVKNLDFKVRAPRSVAGWGANG